MPRTMMLLLQIEVDDLTEEELKKHAEEMMIETEELSGLAQVRPKCIGERLAFAIDSEAMQELVFEGCDDFVRLTKGEMISAVWITKED